MESRKRVLVAGYFDLLHSGHIRFLEEAAGYGDLYVSLGSDVSSIKAKGKRPVFNEKERKYMLSAIRHVKEAHIASASGELSFMEHIQKLRPDLFIINQDGHTEEKSEACAEYGVEYLVLKRTPQKELTPRSSTDLRAIDHIPHRLDLAGGFFDQKKINSISGGVAVICNIEAMELEDRAGMSSSTRRVIHELFGNQLPSDRSEEDIAKMVLAYENFDSEYISGATDAYGLVFSGICKYEFEGSFYPYSIQKINDPRINEWLEKHLYLKLTRPRPSGYQVFDGRECYNKHNLMQYSALSIATWDAINRKDLEALKLCVNHTSAVQAELIPGSVSATIARELELYKARGYGAKLLGAGGFGYMLLVGEDKPEGSDEVVIRRKHTL